jgi:beta-glucosidase
VFDARVSVAPSAAVKMRVDCGYPCMGEIDATNTFGALPVNTWTELAIPLQCFADQGTDFTLVNTPFLLYSSGGQFEVSVANIRWDPKNTGNVPCAGGPAVNVIAVSDDKDLYVNGVSDAAALAPAGAWSYGTGSVTLTNDVVDGTDKLIDVVFNGVTDGAGNGGIFMSVPDNTLIDASAIAATGGVQFEIRVLDYGNSTQDFWTKMVCDRKSETCRTGDLKDKVGHPALNTWQTVKIPFSSPDYVANGFDASKITSPLEMLPAWDDQKGTIHFQIRNLRIVKNL